MGKGKKEEEITGSAQVRIEKMFKEVTVSVAILIVALSAMLSFLLIRRSNETLKNKMSSLLSSNTSQLSKNIDASLDKIETASALIFSDEKYYLYDATVSMTEYEKIQKEDELYSRMLDIGIMDNFADFCIVYSDNQTVGWCSKTTQAVYADKDMYESMLQEIRNEKTQDGWFYGKYDNFDRVYYVKKVNDNAVLCSSFYNRDFKELFETSEMVSGMIISLVDENNIVIYSTDKEEIGAVLREDILSGLDGMSDITIFTDDYLIDNSCCQNGWQVVSYIETAELLKDNRLMVIYTVEIVAAIIVLFGLLAIVRIGRYAKPSNEMISQLEKEANVDGLTGVFNKHSFEDITSENIKKKKGDRFVAFIMIDMDNFKQVNDKKGHVHGDAVLKRFGAILLEEYSSKAIAGRLGGDEFAICFCNIATVSNYEECKEYINEMLLETQKTFAKKFAEEIKDCKCGLSIGVCITEVKDGDNSLTYKEIYDKADKALYVFKENGKNQISWNGPESM